MPDFEDQLGEVDDASLGTWKIEARLNQSVEFIVFGFRLFHVVFD